MAGISSLLKAAAATQKKVQSQEDAFVAYQWESSAQTYDDFVEYSKYLQNRIEKASDPSDALTYQTKLRSANRSYTSNEVQRENMRVMEGNGSTQSKMGAIQGLYQRALDAQDYNLAQNLASQWDTLSVKLQNENEAALKAQQASYATMATNGVKSLTELVKKFQDGTDIIQLPNGQLIKPLARLNADFQMSGAGSGSQDTIFKEAQASIEAMQQAIIQAYQGAGTQEAADSILSKYGDIVDGTKKFDVLGTKLSYQDVVLAAQSQDARNPLFQVVQKRNEATGQLEYSLKKNNTESFVWARQGQDENGNDIFSPVNVRTSQNKIENASLDTQINDYGYVVGQEDPNAPGYVKGTGNTALGTGKNYRNDSMNIRNRLTSLGYQVNGEKDGIVSLTTPDGQNVEATINPDGTIRYYGAPGQYSGGNAGLYEVNLLDQKNFGLLGDLAKGTVREVAPDETSMFATPSKFGGFMSQASTAGKLVANAYGNDLSAIKPIDLRNRGINGVTSGGTLGPINTFGNDFTGRGLPATSSLLQSSAFTLQAKAAEDKKQQMELQAQQAAAQRLQAATAFNLNQTPVQQYAQNGAPARQLKDNVGVLRRTGTVTVAAPQAPRRVTVTNSNPYGQLGIQGNIPAGGLRVVSQ